MGVEQSFAWTRRVICWTWVVSGVGACGGHPNWKLPGDTVAEGTDTTQGSGSSTNTVGGNESVGTTGGPGGMSDSGDGTSTSGSGVSDSIGVTMTTEGSSTGGMMSTEDTIGSESASESETMGGVCGDGVVDENAGEKCDDGAENGKYDKCKSDCSGKGPHCGDGVLNGTMDNVEECDDGNQENTDACTTGCKKAACGDGYLQKDVEECDPGVDKNTGGWNWCGGLNTIDPMEPACMRGRVVFVTEETFTGNLGGVSGADAKCQAEAMNAGLINPSNFKAFLSSSNPGEAAKDRIYLDNKRWFIGLQNENNYFVFSKKWDDLNKNQKGPENWFTSSINGIVFNNNDQNINNNSFTWTGSNPLGEHAGLTLEVFNIQYSHNACSNWTIDDNLPNWAIVGNSSGSGWGWGEWAGWWSDKVWWATCNEKLRLYCFENLE